MIDEKTIGEYEERVRLHRAALMVAISKLPIEEQIEVLNLLKS